MEELGSINNPLPLVVKGTVPTKRNLPKKNVSVGDAYYVMNKEHLVVWFDNRWAVFSNFQEVTEDGENS